MLSLVVFLLLISEYLPKTYQNTFLTSIITLLIIFSLLGIFSQYKLLQLINISNL